MAEQVSIITMRVKGNLPAYGESHQMPCDRCKEMCWISDTTLPRMQEPHEIVCNVCILPVLLKEDPRTFEILAADPKMQRLMGDNKEEIIRWMIERAVKEGGV